MKIKYSTKFILEHRKDKTNQIITKNVPIYLHFTFNGERLQYYTGYRSDSNQWDEEKQKVKKNTFNRNCVSFTIINQRLADIQAKIENIYIKSEAHEQTIPILREKLRIELNDTGSQKKIDLWLRWEKYADEFPGSHGYKKHIKSTMTHLKTYCEQKNINLSFRNCTQDIFESFIKHLKKDHSLNTVSGIIKRVNTFFIYAIKNNWLKSNPLNNIDKINQKYGDPIYLTKQERDYLYFCEIPNERLSRIKDLFLFQCYIGCRVSDLMRLTKDNLLIKPVKNESGEIEMKEFIEYIPIKTKEENQKVVRVPLTIKAKEILIKYDMPGGYLLPAISAQKYNKYIRELFELVKLDRPVTRLNTRTRQEETVPLYQISSSHMARRTFVGLLHRTEKNEVIASMTGHSENSKAFSRYYSVDDDYKLAAIKSLE